MKASTRTHPERREDHFDAPGYDAIGLAGIPASTGEPIRCSHCQAAAPERLFRLAGTWSVVDDAPSWACDRCTREHLFEIESGSASARLPASRRPA